MLQAEKLSNAADKAVFDECRDRIYSMARLHEQLYSSGEFSDLDFAAHLREMAEMLVRSHTPQGCTLVLDVRADPVAVDLDTAVTLVSSPMNSSLMRLSMGLADALRVTSRWNCTGVTAIK